MIEVEKQSSARSATKTNCVSKTTFFKAKAAKWQRPAGNLHRNPYLNFLREFRQRHGDLSAVETIRRGAKEWKNMPKEEKLHYIAEAFYAPKKGKAATHRVPVERPLMRFMPYYEKCGPVCPKTNVCGKKKKRRRKSRKAKCGRTKKRRRPKKRRCAKKRRPKCRRR